MPFAAVSSAVPARRVHAFNSSGLQQVSAPLRQHPIALRRSWFPFGGRPLDWPITLFGTAAVIVRNDQTSRATKATTAKITRESTAPRLNGSSIVRVAVGAGLHMSSAKAATSRCNCSMLV